jgi:ATP-dependent Clp protease adaptor protein ClpS
MPLLSKTAPLLEPEVEREEKAKAQSSKKTKPQKNWFVLLHDDQEHTYDYVIIMLIVLCSMTPQEALLRAAEVDADGVAIIACKPRDEAEALARRISSFGGDPLLGSACSMKATIEPVEA